jgi:hypothetical protein
MVPHLDEFIDPVPVARVDGGEISAPWPQSDLRGDCFGNGRCGEHVSKVGERQSVKRKSFGNIPIVLILWLPSG